MRRSAKIGGLIGLLCLTTMGGCSSRKPLQEQAEQFFSLPLDGSISVENGDGALRVVGWYETRVRLATLRKAYTGARLRQIGVVTKAWANALAVRTEVLPARGFFADRSGTLEIHHQRA